MTTATLSSNGTHIPRTPQYFGTLTETEPGLDGATLRARYKADGYVLLRGAIPAEDAWDLREAYLSLFGPALCKNGDARYGAFSGHMPDELPSHGIKGHPAYDFVRSDTFKSFVSQAVFREIGETFFGAPAERINRTPLRHFIPGRNHASRAHLDKAYIDCLPADVVTIWVPLGDCPVVCGSLHYLEGSHLDAGLEESVRGQAPTDRAHDKRPLTHDLRWISDRTRRRWLATDYRAGDIVVHSPDIVHAALDPGDTDYMRVSTDIRFRRAGSPADPRWADDWSADDGY